LNAEIGCKRCRSSCPTMHRITSVHIRKQNSTTKLH